MNDSQEILPGIRVELRIQNPAKGVQEDELFFKNFSSFIQPIFNLANEFLPINALALKKLIIADKDVLGDVIYQLQDEAGIQRGFTGQYKGHYATAGKTISYHAGNGLLENSVVILSTIVYEIMGALHNETPFEDWSVQARFCFYIIVHEFGHCYDNHLRTVVSAEDVDLENETDWELLGKHYSSSLISEFLASFYAGKSVSDALQEDLIKTWHDDSNVFVEDVLKRKMSFHFTASQAAIHSFWVILVQYAKLVGHKAANDNLRLPSSFELEESEIDPVFQSLIKILVSDFLPSKINGSSVAIDRNLDVVAFEKLIPLWQKLADTYGFEFE